MEGAFVCLPATLAKDKNTRKRERVEKEKIQFVETSLDEKLVAPVIYRNYQHQTTKMGVSLPREVVEELKRFLTAFNLVVGVTQTPFYRLDAYFTEDVLHILEINASFVDGWGTALNLARAAGIRIDPQPFRNFPKMFSLANEDYYHELELFITELGHLGLKGGGKIIDWETAINGGELVYLYGRNSRKVAKNLLPYDGLRLDNKFHLSQLSRQWDGKRVLTPRHYFHPDPWEMMPEDVILKFCDKSSLECQKARHSVIFGRPNGKASFLKRAFREEKLIAQEMVEPNRDDGQNCQLVILAIGEEVATGYVQFSTSRMINDNSTHGPLLLE